MHLNAKSFWGLLKAAVVKWTDDKAPRLGAAISYYTVFAIPPLLVIVLFIAGLVLDPNQVRTQLFSQVGGLVGEKSADAIQSAVAAQNQGSKGTFASIIAVVTLLATATGLFIELQSALNGIWGVEEKPGQGIIGFVRTRVLSFGMVLGIGFLLLVSLVVSAALAAFAKYLSGMMPGLDLVGHFLNSAVSFVVITLLFAMMFKVLPDVKVAWRDVWLGAAITSLLFTVGKSLLGMYLGKSSTVTAYGAAGSIVLLLLWVYYSAQILFFGAVFTQVYATRFGKHPEPKKNAQWVECTEPAAQAQSKQRRAPKPRTASRHQLAPRWEKHVDGLRKEVESLRELVEG